VEILVSWPISTTITSLLASSSLALLLHLSTLCGEIMLWVPAAINRSNLQYLSSLVCYTTPGSTNLPPSESLCIQAPVPPSSPCEYNPLCWGYPLGILSTPLPPDFSCILCQRIARDALITCKGLHISYVLTPEWSHSSRVFCSGPPVLRGPCALRVRAAQAVPALLRGVPERTDRQSCCALCHSGGGGAVPCMLWVGGDAGRARRALGAVPACACPVPGRCGTMPRCPYARTGGKSAAYRHACLPHSDFSLGLCVCICSACSLGVPFAVVACRHCGTRVERGIMEVP